MKHVLLPIAIALIALFIGCTKPQNTSLYIIQTTDVHGCIFPHDFIEDTPVDYSLANIFSYVKAMRKANQGKVVLLDNGDFFQGQPTVYYYNYEDTSSTNFGAEVLNYMHYDAVTIGNHDIECGHTVYDKIHKQLNMPWLAANAINKATGEPYFTPYTIVEREGKKIAILGLITPSIPDWLPETIWKGMVFDDMLESAKKWMKIIQEKEQPDLIVGMFHAGVDYTYNKQEYNTPKNENATLIVAQQVPGFDIVLAGHDHKRIDTTVLNINGDTVFVLDPFCNGQAAASVKIDFIYKGEALGWQKIISTKIINAKDYPADSTFMADFKSQQKKVGQYVLQPLGELKANMHSRDAFFGNSAFIDLIHEVQLTNSGADLSFVAPLSYNKTLQKGTLYVRDLFKLYKYENLLYTMELSGSEIDKFLEYSAGLWFNQMKTRNDNLLLINEGNDGKYHFKNQFYNFSSASGIEYVINVTKPVGKRVTILGFSNGKHFYSNSTYRVAMNSYRGNGGGGHLTQGVGLSKNELTKRIVSVSEVDLRMLLMKYIEEYGVIEPKAGTNWRIIPEDYCEWGKNKDYNLLFE